MIMRTANTHLDRRNWELLGAAWLKVASRGTAVWEPVPAVVAAVAVPAPAELVEEAVWVWRLGKRSNCWRAAAWKSRYHMHKFSCTYDKVKCLMGL